MKHRCGLIYKGMSVFGKRRLIKNMCNYYTLTLSKLYKKLLKNDCISLSNYSNFIFYIKLFTNYQLKLPC